MTRTAEQIKQQNQDNARKSTGPKTDAGKARSRCNALKHGLTATTLTPIDAPGEHTGAYQARLDFILDDLKPQNSIEYVLIERVARSSWKLDRVARYEDAAAARRLARGAVTADPAKLNRRQEAQALGTLLMFAIECGDYEDDYDPTAYHNRHDGSPHPFDNVTRDLDLLCRTVEGVEWLLESWKGVLPNLPVPGEPPPLGAQKFLRDCRIRALRMLGVPTRHPEPSQPLHEAGAAEVLRLQALHARFSAETGARSDSDLSLFHAGPESQLLMRYEAAAERELHRSINDLLKVRKNPELVTFDPEPEPEPEAEAEAPAPAASEAPKTSGNPSPSSPPNEATSRPSSDPSPAPQTRPQGPRKRENGRT